MSSNLAHAEDRFKACGLLGVHSLEASAGFQLWRLFHISWTQRACTETGTRRWQRMQANTCCITQAVLLLSPEG